MLALVAVVGIVVAVVVRRGPSVEPVAQDRPGPVLLVPGFGGSTAALEVLAADLESTGRDVRIVPARGNGTGDLRVRAADLGRAVDAALAETGAPSVDVVGYSAGGVVLRLYVADLGGGSTVRRAVTLSSPHHGTDLAGLAASFGAETCPEACQQLAPDSDLLRDLNAGDETPRGPVWVALWTEDDKTVVPPTSGELDGALDYAVQSVCPDLTVGHPDVPRTPAVVAMVEAALGPEAPARPDSRVCSHELSR
ncbi:Triacylglycerol esterase/lipase EstA, alpha/beta hydrolase fold [Nocardioides exalbidus]|uniref:Triacylglycerol esterase/lipase EstA, alpha/beta hydrolase fold n=1 Tax=Nocardioides exalbidus TaxID=402596 RepID=A0A1H4JUA8_9ACTN|nr:Triacylglycerol esterase/lipase EstA, alpha/beta hydrolase fold [Nocardioides exalbidus]